MVERQARRVKERTYQIEKQSQIIESKNLELEQLSLVASKTDNVVLILDADAAKRRDIDCYRDKFADECWMVIDDYYGADSNEKITPSRGDVDALVAAGLLEPIT